MSTALTNTTCPEQVQFVTDFIDHNLKPNTLIVYLALSVLSSIISLVNCVVLYSSEKKPSAVTLILLGVESAYLAMSVSSAQMAWVLHYFPQTVLNRQIFYYRLCLYSISLASGALILWSTVVIGVRRQIEIAYPLSVNDRIMKLTITGVRWFFLPFCFVSVLSLDLLGLNWMPKTSHLCNKTEVVQENPYLYTVDTVYLKYWSGIFSYFFFTIPVGCSLLANLCLLFAEGLRSETSKSKDESMWSGKALPLLMLGYLFVQMLPDAVQTVYPTAVEETPLPWRYVLFHSNMLEVGFHVLSLPMFYLMVTKFREAFWRHLKCKDRPKESRCKCY